MDSGETSQAKINGDVADDNPYAGGPGAGISLPSYYRPTPSVANVNTYFPGLERVGPDEMRITFLGSCPFPPRRSQAGTCIMVELGNGKRFFFDFGPGCLRNIVAMQVPVPEVTEILLTHLHVDHFGELPYLYGFGPLVGRWSPLHITGPSGRTSELGTKAMIEAMKQMVTWHTHSFHTHPAGDGFEIEVSEFDWADDNGVCYRRDGVEIRHWRRSHGMDGASAYRLDWNGLSFVYTGDGRPDELTVEYSKGVDVLVTELQLDVARVVELKFGMPPSYMYYSMDMWHTPHYAAGYILNQAQPRLGVATHLEFDHDTLAEMFAGIRTHWKGLFQIGLDGTVLNVTKDSVWARMAALPDSPNVGPLREDGETDQGHGVTYPRPRYAREDLQDASTRQTEIDPKKYYPAAVARDLVTKWPT
jgi:ribonuclease Z